MLLFCLHLCMFKANNLGAFLLNLCNNNYQTFSMHKRLQGPFEGVENPQLHHRVLSYPSGPGGGFMKNHI